MLTPIPLRRLPSRGILLSVTEPATSFRRARRSQLRHGINGQLEPWSHGLLSVPFFVLTVPHGKRHSLHPSRNQLGFVFLLLADQRSAHHDMPDPILPRRFTLYAPLLLCGGERTGSAPDQILN